MGHAVFGALGSETAQMLQGQLTLGHGLAPFSRNRPRPLAEHHEVQERVPHETVPPMQSSGGFASDEKVPDSGFAIGVDLHSPILVMQRRIDEYRIFRHIDPKSLILTDHGGEMLFQGRCFLC